MKAIEIACEIANAKRKRNSPLECTLRAIMEEAGQSPGSFSEDIRAVKSTLEVIYKDLFQSSLIRTRAQKPLLGEAPTKRALCMEKRYAWQNHINEVESNGRVSCDDVEMRRAFYVFYTNLIPGHSVDVQNFRMSSFHYYHN